MTRSFTAPMTCCTCGKPLTDRSGWIRHLDNRRSCKDPACWPEVEWSVELLVGVEASPEEGKIHR